MPFNGKHVLSCRAVPFDWQRAHLVVVSGWGPNFCGHAIINAGSYYFHIDGPNDFPWYLDEFDYRRYLRENEKREIRRVRVPLPNPAGAQQKFEELSAKRWKWMVLPNNCATYVEEIFRAGGSNFSSTLNCPTGGWA